MTIPEHAPRIAWSDFERMAPEVPVALRALGKAVDDSGLDKALTELLKLRVSQLNGCAYCIQFHLNIARRLGIAAPKLDLVAAWRDAGVFSARERAALAWAEALTGMAGAHVCDAVYAEVQHQFNAGEIAALTTAVATINAWNRIAGALQFAAPIPQACSSPGSKA
ncbi:MAG: carboxymuconolactone decarboxylase family protein [Betaproteobacteria bacterium]|nr:carboxymuconolactone decarboxylase family protein [Betaproteobacteria bacterium]